MDAAWQVPKNRQELFSIFFRGHKHFSKEVSMVLSYYRQTFFGGVVQPFILLPNRTKKLNQFK
jgi:hypothetical protein